MCGIYGFTGGPEPELAAAMADLLAHRGPDGRGVVAGGELTVGATRLAIQGIETGRQPLSNEGGDIHLACNGEIYNAAALRAEVERRGHRLATGSDCEPLLHLYEDEGDDLLQRVDGMFAFALFDQRRGRLLLARDRMGMKPLFYTAPETSGRLLFASEIKALLAAPEVERRLDEDGLERILHSGTLFGARTLFAGIHHLLPGHRLVWQHGRFEIAPYWRLEPIGTPGAGRATPPPDPVPRFRQLFSSAVSSHLASEAPVGFSLSGGLDSSYVVAVAQRLTGRPVRTYSIGCDGDGDERPWARLLAEHVGTEHHEIEETGERPLERTRNAVWHMELPRNGPILMNELFFERVAPEARVILTGEGADELLGGYDRCKAALPPFSWLPGALGRLPFTLRDRMLGSRRGRLEYPPPEVFAVRGVRRLERLLDCEVRERLAATQFQRLDRLGMGHSVEVRLPFIDRAVVEFVHSLQPRWKTRWRGEKHLLREAARGLLPESIRTRRKYGQREPAGFWRRHGYEDMARDEIARAEAERHGAPRSRLLVPLRRRLDRRDGGNRYALTRLLQVEIWHQLFIDPPRFSVQQRP